MFNRNGWGKWEGEGGSFWVDRILSLFGDNIMGIMKKHKVPFIGMKKLKKLMNRKNATHLKNTNHWDAHIADQS